MLAPAPPPDPTPPPCRGRSQKRPRLQSYSPAGGPLTPRPSSCDGKARACPGTPVGRSWGPSTALPCWARPWSYSPPWTALLMPEEARTWRAGSPWTAKPEPEGARPWCCTSPSTAVPEKARSWSRFPPWDTACWKASKPAFQYGESRNDGGISSRSKASLKERVSRSIQTCLASLADKVRSEACWGCHWTSPFFTRGLVSHGSYIAALHSFPKTGSTGGIGGTGGSSWGGEPSGTLVPFGVNLALLFRSTLGGLTASCLTRGLGVLLPSRPTRCWPANPSIPVETTFGGCAGGSNPFSAVTADQGDDTVPGPFSSCPRRNANSSSSFEFCRRSKSTTSPSRARWRLMSSSPAGRSTLRPSTASDPPTGGAIPGILPSVFKPVWSGWTCRCGWTDEELISPATPFPRPFPDSISIGPRGLGVPRAYSIGGLISIDDSGKSIGLAARRTSSRCTCSE